MNKIIRSRVRREGFTPKKEKYEFHTEVGYREGNEREQEKNNHLK